MRAVAVLLLLVAAVAADSRARASVKPAQGARVGEPVTLFVELITTTRFEAGARLPELDLPGAVVRRLSKFGINGTATIDGVDYTTQTWEYTIYPQRAGDFEVPPLTVRMFPADEPPVDASTERVSFTVAAGGAPLAAQGFEASQVFDPKKARLAVGDAFTRTITLRSAGAPGMLLPPLGATEAAGMTAYPKAPRVDDAISRGDITGTRVESVTYVFERAGTYRFPKIEIPWWNSATKTVESVTLEGFAVEVEGTAVVPAETPTDRSFPWWLLGLLPAAWLALRWRARWADSETAAFRTLTHADGARATYLAVGAWLERADLQPDSELRRQIDSLGDHIYGRGGAWDAVALRRAASNLRRRRSQCADVALPPLNPTR